jgi:tetratricopeptide (TPR) repeat protein
LPYRNRLQRKRWRRGRLRAQHAAALSRSGRDATALFEKAEEDFRAVEARSERDTWFWTWRSTVWSERGIAQAARGEPFDASLQTAERQLNRALDIDRAMMEGWKHRGFLRWTRAGLRMSGDRAGAREDYSAAAADFLEALSINPTLSHQIGDRGDVARRKAAELAAPK